VLVLGRHVGADLDRRMRQKMIVQPLFCKFLRWRT
jgi:hypothetical protein